MYGKYPPVDYGIYKKAAKEAASIPDKDRYVKLILLSYYNGGALRGIEKVETELADKARQDAAKKEFYSKYPSLANIKNESVPTKNNSSAIDDLFPQVSNIKAGIVLSGIKNCASFGTL